MAGENRLRMLTVWWAHWPVVAAGLAGRAPRDRPAIVLAANRVVACSPGATAVGVGVGQRRRVAQQRCPEAVLVDHDPDSDARCFDVVVQAVGEFTPRLEIVEPGWLCIEARGPSRYFGGDDAVCRRIAAAVGAAVGGRRGLEGLGLGIADGRFASAVAARLAADLPDRTMVVNPGAAAAFLAPQPVAWLQQTEEVDAEVVSLFARLGLATLGDLAALPRADVADRFGPPGLHAHRLAGGDDDRRSQASEPPQPHRVERIFDDPVERLQPLVFVGKQLADELGAELSDAGLVCTRLVVTAETEHGERSERVWFRARGLSAAAMVERIRWQLDGWVRAVPGDDVRAVPGDDVRAVPGDDGMTRAGALSAGVVLLRLDVDEVRHDGGDQLRLWGGLSEADERAVRAVARLAGLAGEQAVLVPAWQGGRLPGDRYRWVPATSTDLSDADDTAERLRPVLGKTGPWPGSLPPPSPAAVLDAARPAVVADATGCPVTVGGRGELSATPATLAIGDGVRQAITSWAGPWPLDERWWEERRHRRLARFQVVTADGAAHLVAVERGRWSVLASYT